MDEWLRAHRGNFYRINHRNKTQQLVQNPIPHLESRNYAKQLFDEVIEVAKFMGITYSSFVLLSFSQALAQPGKVNEVSFMQSQTIMHVKGRISYPK